MREISIEKYLDLCADKKAEPGGGSVAVYTGALGVCLMLMLFNLKKEKSEEEINAAKELYEIKKELFEESLKDIEAFSKVFEAFKLPKGDFKKESLKKARKEANVPAVVSMKLLKRALEVSKAILKDPNKNAINDGIIANAMMKEAIYNIRVNVSSNSKFYGEEEFKKDFFDRIDRLYEENLNLCGRFE